MSSLISGGWKLVTSAAFVSGSYFSTWYLERQKAIKENDLASLDEQIKKLYGPLYGHCLVLKASYESVIGPRSGMEEYLSEASEKKDAEAIRRWRAFVWNNIRPLEREIHNVFTTNAHLIADSKFPEEFNAFLSHTARFEFIVERWKNQWGMLETTNEFTADDFLEEYNFPGKPNYNELFSHVAKKYEALQDQRDEILTSLSSRADRAGIQSLTSLIK